MKAIKTFFSLAILFVFVYLITLVLFAVDVFLQQGIYNLQLYSGFDLYLEVLFFSFPLALVASAILSLFMLSKSDSLSIPIFLLTLFALAFLGFGGIHTFARDIIAGDVPRSEAPYKNPFKMYQSKDAFFLFRAKSGELLKDVIAINTSKPLGALGFYPEGVWSEGEQNLKLLPVSSRDSSFIIPKYTFKGTNLVNQNYKSNLNGFLMDLYYVSYYLISLPFLAFFFNLIGFVALVFSVAQFTALFSRLMAVVAMIGLGQLIFFVYRLLIFDMIFIIGDFGLFSPTVVSYFPFALSLLASVSLMGIWQLVSNRNLRRSERS